MSIESLEQKIEELIASGRAHSAEMNQRHEEMIAVLRRYIEHTKPTTATGLYMTGLESVLKDFTSIYQALANNVKDLGVSAARQEAYLARIEGTLGSISNKVCFHAGDCPVNHGLAHGLIPTPTRPLDPA